MGKIELQKNGYNKFAFKGPLAIECYQDANDISEEENNAIENVYEKASEYHELNRQLIKSRDELVSKLINLIEMLGSNNFTIYDDGDIVYNYKNKEEGGNE